MLPKSGFGIRDTGLETPPQKQQLVLIAQSQFSAQKKKEM